MWLYWPSWPLVHLAIRLAADEEEEVGDLVSASIDAINLQSANERDGIFGDEMDGMDI